MSNLLVTWYVLDTEYDHIHIKYISEWKVVGAFTLQAIFLLDVIATLIVIRPSHITSTRKEVLFEIFLQILAAGTILNQALNDTQDVFIRAELEDLGQIFILRNFRLMKYTTVLREAEYI